MSDAPFHPAANLFPLMTEEDFDGLVEDMRQHGLRDDIERLDGKILDGRNRYRACLLARVEPRYIDVTPDDPVAYVMSKNLHRRHLDESQRAMVAARAKEEYERAAKERQLAALKKGPEKPVVDTSPQRGKARDQAGAAVGVSGKSVDRASKVLTKGVPELVKAVDAGKVPVSMAAKVATLPPSKQQAAVAGGKPTLKQAAKEAERAKAPDWAKGPTPAEEARSDPGRRWHANLHGIYVVTTSIRDHGGIATLAEQWTKKDKALVIKELRDLSEEFGAIADDLEGAL